jgi:hypothetical protein
MGALFLYDIVCVGEHEYQGEGEVDEGGEEDDAAVDLFVADKLERDLIAVAARPAVGVPIAIAFTVAVANLGA